MIGTGEGGEEEVVPERERGGMMLGGLCERERRGLGMGERESETVTRGRRPRCFLARSKFGKKRVGSEGEFLLLMKFLSYIKV